MRAGRFVAAAGGRIDRFFLSAGVSESDLLKILAASASESLALARANGASRRLAFGIIDAFKKGRCVRGARKLNVFHLLCNNIN